MSTIPKILHLYWAGDKLSWLQYLTIVSFKRYNPKWKTYLWSLEDPERVQAHWTTGEQGAYEGPDYIGEALKLCLPKITASPVYKRVHHAQVSDIVRGQILYDYGGVWSDLDILYIKPIKVGDYDFTICPPYVGFFIAKPQQEFFRVWAEIGASAVARNMNDDYQATGRHAAERALGETDGTPHTLPTDTVYPYSPDEIQRLFYGPETQLASNTIGIHWYNGSQIAKGYLNNFDKYKDNGSAISNLVKEYHVFDNNAS